MSAEEQKIETSNLKVASSRPAEFWPWVAGAVGLLFYGLTLNQWVTLNSVGEVAAVAGWDWHPTHLPWRAAGFAPLDLVLTYPFRWLPGGWQAVALNVFSAVCAALTLALLARSVRLLPHDRTRDQRKREGGAFGLLSWRGAWWAAPLLAVLALGLQLTFWEHATAATGEMLNLLVFAWLINCLLEYRVSQQEQWLVRFVFVYGLGLSNNWALLGFWPFFLVAMIWIKGISFFHWRFLGRISLWGLAGLSLYLLIPLLGLAREGANLGGLLRAHLGQQKYVLTVIPRIVPLLLAPVVTLSTPIVAAVPVPSPKSMLVAVVPSPATTGSTRSSAWLGSLK